MDGKCPYEQVYRAHIALRRAVLGDMTGKEAAKVYRRQGELYNPRSFMRERFNALADAAVEL